MPPRFLTASRHSWLVRFNRLPQLARLSILNLAASCALLTRISAAEEISNLIGANSQVGTNTWPRYSSILHPKYAVGYWIWTDRALDQQTCRFWRGFEIPRGATVTYARIRMTTDNSYRLFLDGREIGKGGEWRSLNEYNVTQLLGPGQHFLTVEGFSDYAAAGMVLGLHIEIAGARVIEIASDQSWRIIPEDVKNWETRKQPAENWPMATVIAPFLEGPWRLPSARILQGPPLHPIIIRFWQTGWFQITLLSVCGVVGFICVHLVGRLAVQSKAQELLRLERARIARDFHDDLGARITQLVLLGEVAQRELPAGTETRMKVQNLCNRMRDLSGALKEVVWVVNSHRDTVRDFVSYVCNYAEGFFASSAIRCRFDVTGDLPETTFDLPTRRNLFLAVKEALNNAAKYSEASEVVLRVHCDRLSVEVVVEDNGKGFTQAAQDSNRNGLVNMTQRMQSLGGDCRVISQPGKGCRIEFKMPLTHTPSQNRWFVWRRNVEPEAPAPAVNPDLQPRSPEVV